MKQNLKLKGFYGTTKNAVLTQNLDRAVRGADHRIPQVQLGHCQSRQHILRLLQTNLFMRRDLLALHTGGLPDPPHHHPDQGLLAL